MILGLILALLLGSVGHAEEAETLKAVSNPEFPAPYVEQHEPTGDEYFVDAVFLGDSMMDFVEQLAEIPTANYVWRIGMGPSSVGHRNFRVRGQETYLTAYEKVAEYAPKKIYILLGSNGLDWNTSKTVIADYEIMVDELIRCCPEAMIYVISVPPLTERVMIEERNIPPGRYYAFTEELQALAARKDLYYLDFYSLVVDEEGYLPRKYDSGDGFHLTSEAYSLLVDLVRRSTVEYPAAQE